MTQKTYTYTIEVDQPFFPRHLADMLTMQGNLARALISVTDMQRSNHTYGATYQNKEQQQDEPADRTKDLLGEVIELVRQNSFTPEYQEKATPEECLGIALSHYFEWGGASILKTAYEGLEDANFHSEASVLELLLESDNSSKLAQKIFENN